MVLFCIRCRNSIDHTFAMFSMYTKGKVAFSSVTFSSPSR